jgi:predicted small lipoprotein YifL
MKKILSALAMALMIVGLTGCMGHSLTVLNKM